jgi:hypothetical protein
LLPASSRVEAQKRQKYQEQKKIAPDAFCLAKISEAEKILLLLFCSAQTQKYQKKLSRKKMAEILKMVV